jgi:hypothetical protein
MSEHKRNGPIVMIDKFHVLLNLCPACIECINADINYHWRLASSKCVYGMSTDYPGDWGGHPGTFLNAFVMVES